jgi:hypothetical protein
VGKFVRFDPREISEWIDQQRFEPQPGRAREYATRR